ncbi:hypothetical protein QL285_073924 [Trifolium repens]|nr:hypothetical protein QL285_073924 [Trifolium repens]
MQLWLSSAGFYCCLLLLLSTDAFYYCLYCCLPYILTIVCKFHLQQIASYLLLLAINTHYYLEIVNFFILIVSCCNSANTAVLITMPQIMR